MGWTGALVAAGVALGLAGCLPKVQVQVPPSPAVSLSAGTVISVVSADRECREMADALAARLSSIDGIEVRPSAPVRLSVYACGTAWVVTHEEQIHQDELLRRTEVEGRGHAVVSITTHNGTTLAHLIGSGRHVAKTNASASSVQLRRAMDGVLCDAVATDLAEQIAPVPMLVQRRMYANAPPGTARRYHNRAVEAERAGRIDEALHWATEAHTRHPSSRSARYVADLTRRRDRVVR